MTDIGSAASARDEARDDEVRRARRAFLFTDLEGSTRSWQDHPDAMGPALARHDEILHRAIEAHAGTPFSLAGDSFAAAFATPSAAVAAAAEAQRALAAEPWPDGLVLRARMGVHQGVAQARDGSFYGPEVNLAARLMSAGHGGQVLVSGAAAQDLDGVRLAYLGPHRLRDVVGAVDLHQVVAKGLDPAVRSPRVATAGPTLPVPPTPLVGRSDELTRLERLLDAHRLVTLTGPGGVGKTRLAIEVARGLDDRGDAVCFVDLAPRDELDGVWEAFGVALGLRIDGPDQGKATVERVARARGGLFVVDNAEHVAGATAAVVATIFDGADDITVLVTSRQHLGVAGEHVLPLRGLPTAGPDEAGPRLFRARAESAGARLLDDVDTETTVARLCARLDGLPLAIELAASRARVLAPGDVLARLDARLDLLGDGDGTGGLRATIAWSYELLDAEQRRFFDALGAFARTFDAAAAAAVGQVDERRAIALLDDLVARSLVQAEHTPVGIVHRLLETLRAFALEQLRTQDREAAVRDRHRDHYLARYEAHDVWERNGLVADRPAALRDRPEIAQAARRSAEQGRWDLVARHLAATIPTWTNGEAALALDLAGRALGSGALDHDHAGRVEVVQTMIRVVTGDWQASRRHGEAAYAHFDAAGRHAQSARVLALAVLPASVLDDGEAGDLAALAHEVADQDDDPDHGLAWAHAADVVHRAQRHDHEGALASFALADEIHQDHGGTDVSLDTLLLFELVSLPALGRTDEAVAAADRWREKAGRIDETLDEGAAGSWPLVYWELIAMATAAAGPGAMEQGRRDLARAYADYWTRLSAQSVMLGAQAFAVLAAIEGDHDRARLGFGSLGPVVGLPAEHLAALEGWSTDQRFERRRDRALGWLLAEPATQEEQLAGWRSFLATELARAGRPVRG